MAVLQALLISLVVTVPVRAQGSALQSEHRAAPYQILGATLFGTSSRLQKKLDEASALGYHVVAGFERVLILRLASNDERRVYFAAGQGDIESLEREMNAAAASGFRLVPHALLGSFSLAVMERRFDVSRHRVEYRVRSFRDGIDERLAEMAVAGYQVVALLANTIEHTVGAPSSAGVRQLLRNLAAGDFRLRQELIVVFEKEPQGSVRDAPRKAAGRYHLVTGETDADFERELNVAAAAGYRLLTTAPNAFPELIAIVERQEPRAGRPLYGVLTSRKASRVAKELSTAAMAGWVPHPRGVIDPSGGSTARPDVTLVLERKGSGTIHYPVVLTTLTAVRNSTLARELNESAPSGLELVASGAARSELVVVLRSSSDRVER